MMNNDVRVIGVSVTAPGTHPSHITSFKYIQNGVVNICSRVEMVNFVLNYPGVAHTLVNNIRANLRVVEHWVETVADFTKVDNLLRLDRF